MISNLTAKQELFCQNIIKGMTQHDAYVNAYDTQNMLPAVIDVKASELMSNGKISVRVKELRDLAALPALLTVQEKRDILAQIARSQTTDFINDDGQVDIKGKNGRAIREYSTRTYIDKDGNPQISKRVKTINPIEAIAEDNKMAGDYAPVRNINQNIEFVIEMTSKSRHEPDSNDL